MFANCKIYGKAAPKTIGARQKKENQEGATLN